MTVGVTEVKHFELIRALAEHGSLSGVARALGYSQPAISQQVRLLENHLGTSVVVRGRRGVELTEAGKVLLRHSGSILDTVSLAEAEVAAVAGLRTGKVRIAAFPSATPIVAAAMAEMTRKYPGVTFTLTEAEPPRAFELVESGRCDIAVVFSYSTQETRIAAKFHRVPLLASQVRLALPAGHPKAQAERVNLKDLWDQRWIAGCPDCRGHLVQACSDAGFSPDIAFETDDYVALQNLAALGLGVALIPDLALAAVKVEGLQVKRLTPATTQHVSVVSTPGLARLPGVSQTIAAMQQAATKLETAMQPPV